MNNFERRMTEWAEAPDVGGLATNLLPYQRLKRKWESLQWQLAAGSLTLRIYNARCRRLDVELDEVVEFLDRHRENLRRYGAAQDALIQPVPGEDAERIEACLAQLDACYADSRAARLRIADPAFHTRFEHYLREAERLIGFTDQPASPVRERPTANPDDASVSRKELDTLLLQVDARTRDAELSREQWDDLHQRRDEVSDLVAEGKPGHAYWAAVGLLAWLDRLSRGSMVFPTLPSPSPSTEESAKTTRKDLEQLCAALRPSTQASSSPPATQANPP